MKSTIITVLVVALCVPQITADYTRFIYNNADCSGSHVGYYFTTYPFACTKTGCTEFYPGKFWVKEVCNNTAIARFVEGFSVTTTNTDDKCGTVFSEIGGVADTCFVLDTTTKASAAKISSCSGDILTYTTFNDVDCTVTTGASNYSKTCTELPNVPGRYSQLVACPGYHAAPSPVISGPSTSSPMGSDNQQPSVSPTKQSSSAAKYNLFIMSVVFVTIISAV